MSAANAGPTQAQAQYSSATNSNGFQERYLYQQQQQQPQIARYEPIQTSASDGLAPTAGSTIIDPHPYRTGGHFSVDEAQPHF